MSDICLQKFMKIFCDIIPFYIFLTLKLNIRNYHQNANFLGPDSTNMIYLIDLWAADEIPGNEVL